ncbi:isochorismatase family protein [Nocardioides marmotae]|uniref:isochorismatase family protein n=1 Tax=Nocardioides marmotae TaxID=2663857 RepID=UPI0012B58F68|nr:isochorismatase family protein [Nocardioides marmotae]MBC9732800.1 isochorismatase family protein [Nocardioides marmotae]MTB83914.1 isochorismatase family protein [Nocardioides marmotae]
MTSDATLQDYESRGMRGRTGFGRRPCVLVIDFQYGMTDPACALGSANQDEPIAVSQQILAEARRAGVPVIYTVVSFREDLADGGLFMTKVPALSVLKHGSRWVEIDSRVSPDDGDYVLTKRHSSAFIGTELQQVLTTRGIDTVVTVGCSTSGCVRQTAVDANAYGFRSVVVRDAVGDRSREQHEANLVDMDGKYADVVDSEAVIEYFRALGPEVDQGADAS